MSPSRRINNKDEVQFNEETSRNRVCSVSVDGLGANPVSGYKAVSRGIVPDHPVKHTIEDLITGRDRDLELALELARKDIR